MQIKQNDLTEGSIWKKMLLFALPVFFGNLFQQFYNTFDSVIVGKFLGDEALAAVASSGSLVFMLIGFFQGMALGAGVIISRSFGAKDYKTLERTIHTDVAFGLVAGLFLTVFGVCMTPTILRWLRTPENVLPQSISYFRCYSWGILFSVMYNTLVGILHAVGDSRHPLYYLIFSSCVNVVLDLILVGGFHLGVGAAALATTISQGISALLCFIQLVRTEECFKVRIPDIRFHKDSLLEIIHYGLPSGIQNCVISFANLVVQSNINRFGDAAMAGCGSYSKIEGFAFLPITCFTQALSTFVGQNLGAKRYNRVKSGVRFGIFCSVAIAEIVGVATWVFAPKLIALFGASSDAISLGVSHSRTIVLFYCLLAFSHCIAGVMRGAGKVTVPMFTMLGCWCILRVTYITVAVRLVNALTTVSWAYPLTWSCSSLVFLLYFLKADWMHAFEREKVRKLV